MPLWVSCGSLVGLLWVSCEPCGSLVGLLWACRLLASGRLVGALVDLVLGLNGEAQGAGYPQNIEIDCFYYVFCYF